MLKVLINLKRITLVLVCFVMLLLPLTVFSGCTAPETEASHLKVLVLPYLGFATFYIPQDEGYFAEQGLEVEFVKLSTVAQAMPLLAQGELDVVAGPLSASLLNATAQDLNLRIVAGRGRVPSDGENFALMVRSDLYDSGELDTVTEIKGRKVAIPSLATVNDFALAQILEPAGLTVDDVEIVKLYPQEVIAAFENKAIAAATVATPLLERIDALGYATTLVAFNSLMPDFQIAFVIFGPSLLDDSPELGEKFMVAYLKGVRQFAQGKTERNLEILERNIGLDKETLLQACWPPVYPDGRINVEDIVTFQDWAYESGFIDEKVPVEQLIDTRFTEYASQKLGPAPQK